METETQWTNRRRQGVMDTLINLFFPLVVSSFQPGTLTLVKGERWYY
jgi:hypothetical protein